MALNSCPACGAANAPDASRCELCGEALHEPAGSSGESEADTRCPNCSWEGPAGARFCSRCGQPLLEVSDGPREAPPDPKAEPRDESASLSPRAAMALAAAVLLLVALYLVNVVASDRAAPDEVVSAPTAPSTSPAPLEPDPLAPNQAEQVAALEREIRQLEGQERLRRQEELVDLLIDIGRPDHAALAQEEVAEAVDTPDAWRRAGNLFYDWTLAVPEQRKPAPAAQAVAAFENVLEEDPGDLDVRADLAWVYQYDPQNAMQAINQNNFVLERDPDHVQANFNRALFLLRINRVQDAVDQLERVKQLVGEESPLYDRADEYLEQIRQASGP